ncbi:hypothetical protein B0T13DRAFT_321726 [Neurospora crassa]|nr:hypothetical protein B0T13DRAFT_321726 [Neurospora crassa]
MADPQYARRRASLDPSFHAGYSPHTHSRSRNGSNGFASPLTTPPVTANHQMQMPMPMHLVQSQSNHQRRSPSVNTFSTVSSGGGMPPPPAAYRTSPTSDIRRSTSSRSGGTSDQPTSYVALLRKQKATVWCDRAQYEDPRLLAQQRAAKTRAAMEVSGAVTGSGTTSARTITGLSAGGKVAAKIRHHGKPTVVGYIPDGHHVGVGGIPLRLSATEVEGEDSDDDNDALNRYNHRRTGSSSRSSTASGRKGLGYRASGQLGPSNSQGSGSRRWTPGDTPERRGSLAQTSEQASAGNDAASGKALSFASGSSSERLDAVPDLQAHPQRQLATNSLLNATLTREKSVKNPEELKRRGSVDERTYERTMTFNSSGRLFIANPD